LTWNLLADRDVCLGAGVCVRLAPRLFDQDDDHGLVVLLMAPSDDMQVQDARAAVEQCPSGALSFVAETR
jgi:ferredoxin